MSQNHRNNLKIHQLRAFVTVADCGNFSAAALELDLSQSTISHAIAALEEELGVVLLVRGRHGATLTAIGEQILADARQVLERLDAIQEKATLDKKLQSGVIRIAAVRSIATHLLPDAVVQFRQKFPLITVVIRDCEHYIEIEQLLLTGQVELGITLLPAPSEFETWQLMQDEFVVLLPAHAPHCSTPLTWEQLTSYPMIISMIAAPYVHARLIQNHLMQFGYHLNIAYEVKEDSTIIGMVKRGLGATIIPRLAAEPIPEGIQIHRLPVPLERSIGAAILKDALLPKAVFAFLDVLKAVVAEG